jgi:hypothetical protein
MEFQTPGQAWQKLKDLVKAEAEGHPFQAGQTQLRWVASGRLVLVGPWQVEAWMVEQSGRFQIRFDRFGAQLGSVNFELPPGRAIIGAEVWDLKFVEGEREVFWRLNGQHLSPDRLARKVVDNLNRYYDAYRLSAVVGT